MHAPRVRTAAGRAALGALLLAATGCRAAAPPAAAPAPRAAHPPTHASPASAGVPTGWRPTRSVTGDVTVDRPGAVVEDLLVTDGDLLVRAPDVTLRRVRVRGGIIDAGDGGGCQPGLVVEHASIGRAPGQLTTDTDRPALGPGGYTARHVEIDGLPEGFRVGGHSAGCGPVTIEDSYARVVHPDRCADWHGDGLQGYDGAPVHVRDTTLELVGAPGCEGTAPFFYPDGQGNASVDVDGLLVEGGGVPFRLGTTGSVRRLEVVAGSWGYSPLEVRCPLVGAWSAHVVRRDASGRYVPVRPLPCGATR